MEARQRKRWRIALLVFIFSFNLLAQDKGISMPDYVDEDDKFFETTKDSSFLPDYQGKDDYPEDENAQSVFLPGPNIPEVEKATEKSPYFSDNKSDENQPREMLKQDLSRQLIEIRKKRRFDMSYSFLYDSFDYTSSSGIFDSIYRNDDSRVPLMLVIGYSTNWKKFFRIGGNFGVSYNSGKGSFSDNNALSSTQFTLWTLPLEPHIGFEAYLTRYFSFIVQAGPSVVLFWQSRDDLGDGDPRKNRRQIATGGFASAELKFRLSEFFPAKTVRLSYGTGVTGYSVNLMARTQSYASQKEDGVEVSGVSFGIGFTAEYK